MGAELNAVLVPNEATATYEWQRADESGGQYTAIPLATEKTYTLAPEDESKFIKVKAVGNGNYTGNVTSTETSQITSA